VPTTWRARRQAPGAGNALRWAYTLKLPVDGKVYEVQFDDWMFLVDDPRHDQQVHAMSKFGVQLGRCDPQPSRRSPRHEPEPRKLKDWRGKTVWLVGASTGIGAALARALHARGAQRGGERARCATSCSSLCRRPPRQPGRWPSMCSTPLRLQQRAAQLVARSSASLDFVLLYCAGSYTPLRADGLRPGRAAPRRVADQLPGRPAIGWTALLPQLLAQAAQGRAAT
jgi:hypothetical protein